MSKSKLNKYSTKTQNFKIFESKKKYQRNQVICEKILSGKSIKELSKKFGLTRERIRQIILENKLNYSKISKERRDKLFQQRLKQIIEKADKLGRIPCGYEIKEFELGPFRNILIEKGYEYKRKGPPKIDDRVLLKNLKDLSIQLGRTAGVNDLNKYGKHPHTTYFYHFGSITNAQKLAGLKPNKVGNKAGPYNFEKEKVKKKK